MGGRGPQPRLFTAKTAKRLLGLQGKVSTDLDLSEVVVSFTDDGVRFPDGCFVCFEDLERVSMREDGVFFVEGGSLYQVAISDGHYYKLVLTEGAPTLEIDGVRMHRTKGINPERDAAEKVEALGIEGGRVLDTCTGLGYTAIAALSMGVELVVSIERGVEVLRIAELNPWSSGIFTDGRVHLLLGDAFSLIDSFPDEFFNWIIHDPPRFALAGHLYGGEFYARMSRVLRPGGRVFHYTGEPGSRRRRVDLRRGVMRRLGEAGFFRLRFVEGVMGVVGERRPS
ncbi:MAG: SAM-dependent methyltransferase [Candidatus Bathyarchaeota archaeon]|nr:MAG: SAM-dependent methyltransferase [Candidatus Bathyarchaeota archaeon]